MLHIFAAVLALSDPTGTVVEARIADVIAEPERFGGQTLRLRGQVDACYGYVCSICPEEMTPETADRRQCLAMAFDDSTSEEDRAQDETSSYVSTPWRDIEASFRFSVLTAEGTFDPSCLTHRPWPPEPRARREAGEDMMAEVVCMDRATTWRGVQVRSVHRRLPSNEGLVFGRDGGRLEMATNEISDAVSADYRRYLALIGSDEEKPLAVFRPEFPDIRPDAVGEEARLCVCLKASCEGEWPRRDLSTSTRTPNDPYVCHMALKTDGVWRVFPE